MSGILGHVARSGAQELVWAAPQHMFFDPRVDLSECELSEVRHVAVSPADRLICNRVRPQDLNSVSA
jgi:hypothetical protein